MRRRVVSTIHLVILVVSWFSLSALGQKYVITSPKRTINQSLLYSVTQESNKDVIIIGSMFPLHNDSSHHETDKCGPVQGEDGILPLEALIFTVKEINKDPKLLPGIRLGVLALDSCNSPKVALQQSLRFMKGFLASLSIHHESGFQCNDGGTLTYEGGKYDNVVGVIGGQHSSVSIQMANVLRLFKIPQVSYRSTSSSLGDRDRYPFFLRTIPSDNNQVEVILEILVLLKVSYVSLVHSNTDYGRGGATQLLNKAAKLNSQRGWASICFGDPPFPLKINDPPETYQKVVESLMIREKANVVILFADLSTTIQLMKAVEYFKHLKPEAYRKLLWIGSDAWTSHPTALSPFGDIIQDAIGIQPLAIPLSGFYEYFSELTPDSNKWNPWFNEYWEDHFNCSLNDNEDCARQSLKGNAYVNAKWLHLVRDAAFAFAHALHNMWESHCGGVKGLCEAMGHDGHIHGEDLYEALKNVSFLDVANEPFQFQGSGEGTARYTLFVYRSRSGRSRSFSPWYPIANFTYQSSKPTLHFLSGREESFPYEPNSRCSQQCKDNEYMIEDPENKCCWSCKNCSSNQYLNTTSNYCETCDRCHRPDHQKRRCVTKEDQIFEFGNQWAITSMVFATLGIFSTIFVGIIFWIHFDTPVIKAASRELSYTLLGGILLSFCLTFAILMPPSPIWCGITRFFMGFSYTICYAAILTKTNRIHRVFNINPSKPQKAKYTSTVSQMMIVLFLVCVEVVIVVPWLVYYQPEVKKICKSEQPRNTIICKGIDDFSYIIGFIYPFFLVCLCTFYAIKTRKSPDGFNEARYIAFSNYTTCILWIIFIPLYLTTPTEQNVRLVALSLSLSLGAFVQLVCLFIPKVHIVLFKPEKNTKDSVMSQPRSSSQGNPNTQMANQRSAPTFFQVQNADPSTYPAGVSPSPNYSQVVGQNAENAMRSPAYLAITTNR